MLEARTRFHWLLLGRDGAVICRGCQLSLLRRGRLVRSAIALGGGRLVAGVDPYDGQGWKVWGIDCAMDSVDEMADEECCWRKAGRGESRTSC